MEIKTCKDCGNLFEYTDGERNYFLMHGLYHPKRCNTCRAIRKGIADKVLRCQLCKKKFVYPQEFQLYARSYGWSPPTTCLGGCGKEKYAQDYQLSQFELLASEVLGGLARYVQGLFNEPSSENLLADEDILCEAGIDSNCKHVLNHRLKNLSTEVARELNDLLKNSRANRKLLLKGLSNPVLDERMAIEIPGAVVEILRMHPDAAGLFTALSNRGPGARPWIVNLNNPKSPVSNGAAYELLATRKLMHKAAGDLKLYAGDKIAFGPKLQARYEPSDLKAQELLGALINIAPTRWKDLQEDHVLARRTVESDISIYQNGHEIFVDFKYTGKNSRWIEPAELLGIAVALSTGEINEAYFICNASLSESSQKRINDINILLNQWKCNIIKAHHNFDWSTS
jgi:hypothetical protein